MRYLVTGVTGQLGFDVVRILKENGITNIYAPTSSEFDITNKEIVVSKTKEFNPDVIIHCAAYTKVDQAEIDTDTCYKVNVDGTKNMTEAAKEVDAKIIYISTDYVFDGEKKGAYLVNDKTNPKSIYGKTKLEGEKIVSSYLKFYI
ncbi:NAD(P)-dependent oxidoreductase [bacterium]|nr:NAD(P)-dependent oxidoreductase [bacterium]